MINDLRRIAPDELVASDLRAEAHHHGGVAYAFRDARGERREALLIRDAARLGVWWGGDSSWGDVPADIDPEDRTALERAIVASYDDCDWEV